MGGHIVEGCVRESQVEFLRFLEIAFSSLRELHYQFGLSKHIGYLHENNYTGCELKLVESENIGALIRSLRNPNRLQSKPPE